MSTLPISQVILWLLLYMLGFLPAVATAPVGNSSIDDSRQTVNWQPNPGRRGTLNIIESCIFTILICTWSIQRLNPPGSADIQRVRIIQRVRWAMATIIAPEFILALAIEHKRWAKDSLKAVKADFDLEVEPEGDGWWKFWSWPRLVWSWLGQRNSDEDLAITLKHCYYGNMGGFRVPVPDADDMSLRAFYAGRRLETPVTFEELIAHLCKGEMRPSGSINNSMAERKNGDSTEAKSVESGNSESTSKAETEKDGNEMGNKREDEGERVERTKRILRRLGLTKAEIDDKDKGNFLTTTVAVLQLFWLGFSVCTRAVRRLATSQLEIVTLAFVFCAFITYIINWGKPQNIRIATSVQLNDLNHYTEFLHHPLTFDDIINNQSVPCRQRGARLQNGTVRPIQRFPVNMVTCFACFLVIIGAVHLAAWNFTFPTRAELILWRVAVVASIGIPILPLSLTITWFFIDHQVNLLSHERAPVEAQRFASLTYRAMEHYDTCNESSDFKEAAQELRNKTGGQLRYRDIFDQPLAQKLNGFIQQSDEYTPSFAVEFDRLAQIIRNLERKTKPDPETGAVDLVYRFPLRTKKERLEQIQSRVMRPLYRPLTVAYAASRLIIISLAFSSLRAMPDSVYQTTWTRYIPFLQ